MSSATHPLVNLPTKRRHIAEEFNGTDEQFPSNQRYVLNRIIRQVKKSTKFLSDRWSFPGMRGGKKKKIIMRANKVWSISKPLVNNHAF
jgi:hypothetical protein